MNAATHCFSYQTQNTSVAFSCVTKELAFSKATRFTKRIFALCKHKTRHTDYKLLQLWNSNIRNSQLIRKISKKEGNCFSYYKDTHGIPILMETIHFQMLLHACKLCVSKFSRSRFHYYS